MYVKTSFPVVLGVLEYLAQSRRVAFCRSELWHPACAPVRAYSIYSQRQSRPHMYDEEDLEKVLGYQEACLFFPSPPMDLGVRPSGDRTHRGSGSLARCDVPYKLLLVAMTGARSCCLHSTPDYASNLCASDVVSMAPGLAAFSVFPNARRVPEKYPYALILRSFLLT